MTDIKMEGSALIQELDWKPHRAGFIAQGNYENGYGISILPEYDGCHYEVAILKNGKICYDTPITNDVLRFVDVDGVHQIILKVKNL